MGFEGQALSEVIYGRLFGKAARTPGMGRRELMKLWARFMPMVKSSETLRSSANNGTKD